MEDITDIYNKVVFPEFKEAFFQGLKEKLSKDLENKESFASIYKGDV